MNFKSIEFINIEVNSENFVIKSDGIFNCDRFVSDGWLKCRYLWLFNVLCIFIIVEFGEWGWLYRVVRILNIYFLYEFWNFYICCKFELKILNLLVIVLVLFMKCLSVYI